MQRLPPTHVYSINLHNKSAGTAHVTATYTNHEGAHETVTKEIERGATAQFEQKTYQNITVEMTKHISKLNVKLDGNKHFEVTKWNVSSPTRNLDVTITNDGILH